MMLYYIHVDTLVSILLSTPRPKRIVEKIKEIYEVFQPVSVLLKQIEIVIEDCQATIFQRFSELLKLQTNNIGS